MESASPFHYSPHPAKCKNTDESDSAASTKSSHHARSARKDSDEGLDMATMRECVHRSLFAQSYVSISGMGGGPQWHSKHDIIVVRRWKFV